jgi:hypothetical protein
MIWSVAMGLEHIGDDIVSFRPVVIVEANASSFPIQVTVAPSVIPASSIAVHINVVLAPSVIACVGVQKISQADAPSSITCEFTTVVRAPLILKI